VAGIHHAEEAEDEDGIKEMKRKCAIKVTPNCVIKKMKSVSVGNGNIVTDYDFMHCIFDDICGNLDKFT